MSDRVRHYVRMAAAARQEEDKSHGRFAYAAAKVVNSRIRDRFGIVRADGGAQLLANQVGMSPDSVENAARSYLLLVAIHQKRITSLSKQARGLWRTTYKSLWETAAKECFKKGGHGDPLLALSDIHHGTELTHDEFKQVVEDKYAGDRLPHRMRVLMHSALTLREDLLGKKVGAPEDFCMRVDNAAVKLQEASDAVRSVYEWREE